MKIHGGSAPAAWKAFHDELLSHGGPPIGLLRDALLSSSQPSK